MANNYVHWLKVAQDTPVSVAHIQALDESAEHILRTKQNAVYAEMFHVSSGGLCDTERSIDGCIFPENTPIYKAIFCYTFTGAPVATTFSVKLPYNNSTITYTGTETPSTSGVQYFTISLITDSGLPHGFHGTGKLTYSCDQGHYLLFAGLFAYPNVYEPKTPKQGAIADSQHFATIVNKIQRIYTMPHLAANWTGDYQVTRDSLDDVDPLFRVLSATDADDAEHKSSCGAFNAVLCASMGSGTSAQSHLCKMIHNDSSDSIILSGPCDVHTGLDVPILDGEVHGISYMTGSGWSMVTIDSASEGTTRHSLKSLIVHFNQRDYQTARYSDSLRNHLVSLGAYEPGDVISYGIYNAAARALFSVGHHTSNPCSSGLWLLGTDVNYAAYTTILRYPLWIRDHWIVGKLNRNYIRLTSSTVWHNSDAAKDKTVYVRYSVNGDNHIDSFTAGKGAYTHRIHEFELEKPDYTDDFVWIEVEVYISTIATPSIDLWCHQMTPLTTLYTV